MNRARQLLRSWWFVAVGVALLVARKPWALHTPQLHAEDGTIFLQQDDSLGAAAFVTPYMGYLHLLPRLIAWLASHTADPRWWPAIYNGAAFTLTALMLARFASPRLDVPGKPWLVLAFALVAHTGEVLFNATNLQWLTAFFLVQGVLMARPATWPQRLGDLTLLALAGLTGPFAIVLLPLYAWRAWRERHADALGALLLVAVCAGIQASFLAHAELHLEGKSPPFHAGMFFAVLGRRLWLWPVLGAKLTESLSPPVLGAIGGAALGVVAFWVLRPHPRRLLRAQILATAALLALACFYRARPDAWAIPDIVNGDRYFYVPRVLIAWLLIWEFDATPRAVAFAARVLCIAGALANLPEFRLAAPRDYHWAEHCDAIRRGENANIPTLPEGWTLEYHGRPHPH